jgi:hypothetical protein
MPLENPFGSSLLPIFKMNIHPLLWLAVLLVGLVAVNGQKCGGRDYHGDGKCPTGYTCKDVNDCGLSSTTNGILFN